MRMGSVCGGKGGLLEVVRERVIFKEKNRENNIGFSTHCKVIYFKQHIFLEGKQKTLLIIHHLLDSPVA